MLEALGQAIASIKKQSGYGSIEITLHDGRVTQIERREKVRLEQTQSNKSPTGKTVVN